MIVVATLHAYVASQWRRRLQLAPTALQTHALLWKHVLKHCPKLNQCQEECLREFGRR